MTSIKHLYKRALFAIGFGAMLCLPFAEAQAQKLENTLLWKVEGKDINTSYFFGTIHVMPQAQFELKDKVVKALDESKLLALELDMSDPSMQGKMMQMAGMKDGVTLDKLLDAHTYQKLDTMLQQSLGASVMFINGFKPFVVSSLLIGRLIDGQQASYELVLIQEAKKREMPVKGLETIESQMAIFDKIPYESQAEDLAEMIHDEVKMKKMYAEMVSLYQKEQLTALYDMLVSYMEDPQEREELLGKRNRAWIPIVKEWSAEKPVFYAVGAAHLGGSDGVIALLREAGYKVTPVM